MKVTRRDLLVWSAGAAAGLLATPVPWKVLDDVSIWSQNWPWIPQAPRGPVELKASFCTLCPKGCGLRVRMAAGWPVGVSGSKAHPMTHGALCPLAFAAHQLNWHPQRLRSVRHQSRESSWADAQNAFARACQEGPIVVVDGYPGRAASTLLQSFAEKQDGSYRVFAAPEVRSLAPYESWSGVPATSLGYDFENTKTLLSFGAPLLDGWGTPGPLSRLWAERAAGRQDPDLRLIQIDAEYSRTACRAWRWIRIREGSQAAFAAGLARALLEQNLVPAHGPVPPMTIAEAAAQSEASADVIRELARTMVEKSPALVIARDHDPAVATLNVLLGSVGIPGGVVRSSRNSDKHNSADEPIARARAVLIDSTVPWDCAPPSDAEVYRFGAWDGGATKADWLLPAPGFLEETTDVPTAPAASVESYAIAPSLLKPASDVRSSAQFLCDVDPTLVSMQKIIHKRCEDIFHRGAGTVYGLETSLVGKFSSVQKLEEELANGAVWIAPPSPAGNLRCELRQWPSDSRSVASSSWTADWMAPVLPPVASKFYVESTLREAPGRNT
jgi:menaquinone reductase, molybdopterin-binding-like subunit